MVVETRITIQMSPDKLRDLADKMEREFPKLLPGDSSVIDVLGSRDNIVVLLSADQEWFHKRARGEYESIS